MEILRLNLALELEVIEIITVKQNKGRKADYNFKASFPM